jgi:four helix bundle protein
MISELGLTITVDESTDRTENSMIRSFRDLIAWQKAMDLSVEVYELTRGFPREEIFGLSNQLRRSAVSIPSNIAQAQGRSGTREFQQFLSVARGSLCELQTQLEIARRTDLANPVAIDHGTELAHEVGNLLFALLRSLKAKET